jgi:hypothetical protein
MPYLARSCAAAVVYGVMSSSSVTALEWTKVVDTATPLRGAAGRTIYTLSAPSLSNGNAVFATEFSEFSGLWQGVFAHIDGQLVKVVDDTTPFPGAPGMNFSDVLFTPTIDGRDVAFQAFATDWANEGIFMWSNGQITTVTDTSMTVPGSPVKFFTFGGPHISNGRVVFAGVDEDDVMSGIYTNAGTATFRPVVDYSTPLPGGDGTFSGFPYLLASETMLNDGRAIFLAQGKRASDQATTWGVYVAGPNGVRTLAQENVTPMPGGGGVFTEFDLAVADDDASFAVEGRGANGQRGIYVFDENGVVRTVMDTNTPIPGGSGNFNWEHRNLVNTLFSCDNGGVLFEGFGANDYEGIFYAGPVGRIIKLIDRNDVFDGKAVDRAFIDRASLDGGLAGIWVQFEDGTEGIYIAAVPEPATAAVLAIAGALRLRRRR